MKDKIKSVVGDSRFWLYVFVVASSVFGIPELGDNAENLSKDVAEAVVLILQGVSILVGTITFMLSLERRPLSAKESVNKLQQFSKFLQDAGVKFE